MATHAVCYGDERTPVVQRLGKNVVFLIRPLAGDRLRGEPGLIRQLANLEKGFWNGRNRGQRAAEQAEQGLCVRVSVVVSRTRAYAYMWCMQNTSRYAHVHGRLSPWGIHTYHFSNHSLYAFLLKRQSFCVSGRFEFFIGMRLVCLCAVQ